MQLTAELAILELLEKILYHFHLLFINQAIKKKKKKEKKVRRAGIKEDSHIISNLSNWVRWNRTDYL